MGLWFVLAASFAWVAATTPAHSQSYFKFDGYNLSPFGYSEPYYKPRKKKPRPVKAPKPAQPPAGQTASTESPTALAAIKSQVGPLIVSVSIAKQRVAVFGQDGLVTEAPISTGRVGYPTPTGIFSILEKNKVHFSNLYHSSPMPNMQRITWSGVALHAGPLPGYPASHGCIRLPHGFSQKLFEMTKMGTRVIVTRDPVVPQSFAHPRLFNAYPSDDQVTHSTIPASETRVADATPPSRPAGGSVSGVIGVSTAVAAGAGAPPSRISPFRQAWKAEMARLATSVAATEKAKADAAAAAAETAQSLDETKAMAKKVRGEFERLSAEEKKARRALEVAESQLETFAKRLTKTTAFTPETTVKAAENEDKLEANALDLAEAVEDASADVADVKQALELAGKEVAAAEAKHRGATSALTAASRDLEQAKTADAAAKRRDAKRKNSVHVFISRKTQKLYVRQGYEPILESPVTFADPGQPVGTHVFTAMNVADDKSSVSWTVASVPTLSASAKPVTGKDQKSKLAPAPTVSEITAARAQTPQAALERITIPGDIRDQIEDVMKPGSSLIISDNGLSNETGVFTDFIVPIR